MDVVSMVLLAALLVPAAFWDVRHRTVPNVLTVSGLVAGFIRAAVSAGLRGLVVTGGVVLVVLAVGFVLQIAGVVGGGDAKLVAAMGAIGGPAYLRDALVWLVILSVIVSIVVLVRSRALVSLLQRLGRAVFDAAVWQLEPAETLVEGGGHTIPFAAVIAAAGSIAAVGSLLGWNLTGAFS